MRAIPAVLVLSLVLLPLLGLGYGLLAPPPPALFGGAATSLGELVATSKAVPLLIRSLSLSGVVALISLLLGTWLAWLEQRCCYPGRRVLAIGALLPLAVPSYLLAAVLRHELSAGGSIGGALGLPPFTGLVPAAICLIVITTPLVQLVVGSALARSSAAEEEAARTLGASRGTIFRVVWLPRLRPAWAMSLLLVALYAVSDFGAVAVLDCPVLTWRLYQAVDYLRVGEAAVLGTALLAATVPLVIAARWIQGHRQHHAQVANPRPAPRRQLPLPSIIASYVVHLILIGLGVILPVITLGLWLLRRIGVDELASIATPVRHSLLLGGIGTAVVLVLALLPAWQAARGRRGGAIDHSVYLTAAIPGILLAGGLLLAALAWERLTGWKGSYAWLLGSGVLLMLGYAARFLSEAFAPLKTAVLAADQRQDETARSLGAGRLRRWRVIYLPALAPGTAAAAVLVFVAILKELPITLILGGAMGLRPLSYRVWERYDEAFLADAGLAGLLLMALGLAAVLISLRFRRHV
ncbi:MAG: ABC transporter permease subunit [Planctomycetota bacterium]|jgi:iron(III) transport system permease protein|nr:ABC transporter permease subunit [Planctomycetota bacterium]